MSMVIAFLRTDLNPNELLQLVICHQISGSANVRALNTHTSAVGTSGIISFNVTCVSLNNSNIQSWSHKASTFKDSDAKQPKPWR